jgi:hypothetical protein
MPEDRAKPWMVAVVLVLINLIFLANQHPMVIENAVSSAATKGTDGDLVRFGMRVPMTGATDYLQSRRESKNHLKAVYEYPAPPGQRPEDLMECFLARFPGHSPLVDDSFFKEPGPYMPEDMAEWYLHEQLRLTTSVATTVNPADAGLFVVNVMPVLSSIVDQCNNMSHVERQLWWVDTMVRSPWMRLRKGRDHAFICQSWTCSHKSSPKYYPKTFFSKQWIEWGLTPPLKLWVDRMTYWIHEDTPLWTERNRDDLFDNHVRVVPYVAHSELQRQPYNSTKQASLRRTLAVFIGSTGRRSKWRAPMNNLRGVRVVNSGLISQLSSSNSETFARYADGMHEAVFCLVPAGDTRSSRRLFDAVMAGCIPVFVGPKYTLPFERMVMWDDFTVRLNETRWLDEGDGAQFEIDKLAAFEPKRIETMRASMAAAAPSLDWRNGDGVLRALLKY